MATFRALTIQAGTTSQQKNADVLLVGAGVDANTAQALSVGAANATSLSLGAAGKPIGFYGVAPALQPTITGSRGGNSALTSFVSGLASLGLAVNTTTPTVANIAALAAIDTTGLANGVEELVSTVQDKFTFNAASLAVADGISIVAPTVGPGRWFRRLRPNYDWMSRYAATSPNIDTATGDDENDGSAGSPLKTWKELRRRIPFFTKDMTAIIAAGSVFAADDPIMWQPICLQEQVAVPTLRITGTRTLGPNLIVAASTDELGNAAPTLTVAAMVWTPNTKLQATSGAQSGATTSVVFDLGAGVARTGTWRSAIGIRVPPPAPGDTVAIYTNPFTPQLTIASDTCFVFVQNIDTASYTATTTRLNLVRTCTISGVIAFTTPGLFNFQGVTFGANVAINNQATGARVFFNDCQFVRTGAAFPNIQAIQNCFIQLFNAVIQGGGVECTQGALMTLNSAGIFDAPGFAVDSHDGGQIEVNGTIYGTGSALGSRARENGNIRVFFTITPTLASVGQELQLEFGATAIPELVAGAAVPAASALTSWALWAAAPFTRNVMSYRTGSVIINRT